MSRRLRPVTGLAALTARQQEVLALLAEGWSNAAIARALSITERGVVQHVTNIYLVLGLLDDEARHRRVVAVRRYLELVAAGGAAPAPLPPRAVAA